MIVQCATFSKSVKPRNIDKSVSDIRIRFPFESRFWISVSGCKLTILPDIQQENRIVIIPDACFAVPHACLPNFFHGIQQQSQKPLKGSFPRTKFIAKKLSQRSFTKSLCFLFFLCLWFKTSFKILKWSGFIHWKQGMHCILCIHWRYAPASTPKDESFCNCKTQKNYSSK